MSFQLAVEEVVVSSRRKRKSKERLMSSSGTNGSHGSNGTNGSNGNGNGSKRNALCYWATDPRWSGITRPYSYSAVLRLRGPIQIEYTLPRVGAERFWNLMNTYLYVPPLRALTGHKGLEL